MTNPDPTPSEPRPYLNLLCVPVGDAWRVFTAPTWMPDTYAGYEKGDER